MTIRSSSQPVAWRTSLSQWAARIGYGLASCPVMFVLGGSWARLYRNSDPGIRDLVPVFVWVGVVTAALSPDLLRGFNRRNWFVGTSPTVFWLTVVWLVPCFLDTILIVMNSV